MSTIFVITMTVKDRIKYFNTNGSYIKKRLASENNAPLADDVHDYQLRGMSLDWIWLCDFCVSLPRSC
jgi:hypothetical protein